MRLLALHLLPCAAAACVLMAAGALDLLRLIADAAALMRKLLQQLSGLLALGGCEGS